MRWCPSGRTSIAQRPRWPSNPNPNPNPNPYPDRIPNPNPNQESLSARAIVSAEMCSEVVECRYWDDEKNAWRSDNCRTVTDDNTTDNAAGGVGGGVGEVRCECDHLTDFIVVKAPTSWDEFMQSALEGFEVHVFS